MTLEAFVLYNALMATLSWYLMKRHGDKEYEEGLLDAVLMHNSGQLTYSTYTEGGETMINMEIKPDEG
jgi:hypothetical protein